jgi:hypothetical protein
MGVFSGMSGASSTQGGNYLRPGNYVVQIQCCKLQQSQANTSRSFFVAELKVVESAQVDEVIKPNAKDEDTSWLMEVPGKYPELSLGNIKALLKAAYSSLAESQGEEGPEDNEIDEEMTEYAVGEDNPLAGVFVVAKAFHKQKKNSDGVFTRVQWAVPENLDELVQVSA